MLGVLLLLGTSADALQGNAGGNTSEFLNIGAGARALGMGEAYGPVAEGANAIYWNPAGLASLHRPDVSYSRQEFLEYFHHDFVAYAMPVSFLRGAVGASFTHLTQNSLPLVTNANATIGRFAPHSEAFSLSYAHAFSGEFENNRERYSGAWYLVGGRRPLEPEPEMWTGPFTLGATIKALTESYYDKSSSAFAVDAGALYTPVELEFLRLSAVVKNLGSRQEFNRQPESLPLEADLGAAARANWESSHLIGACELALPYYGLPYAKLGVEYRMRVAEGTAVAFRGGYKTLAAYDLSPLAGITTGLGFSLRRLDVDFAVQPLADLGNVYRFTLGYRW
ncbi:MAG: hypothetical protein HY059_09820 [Proteobacteria bacterium]|nr:hypothetical protein [Pseudomonadota bacterium]